MEDMKTYPKTSWGSPVAGKEPASLPETSALKVKFLATNDDVILPTKAHDDDGCYDLYSNESLILPSGEGHLFKLGFKVEVPKGYTLDIRPRSGLSAKAVIIPNSPGTVDAGYRGEVGVLLFNAGRSQITINKKDRIAQCMLSKVIEFAFEVTDKLSDSTRGEGGFGSSGK